MTTIREVLESEGIVGPIADRLAFTLANLMHDEKMALIRLLFPDVLPKQEPTPPEAA